MNEKPKHGKNKATYLVCYCNEISKETIEGAIARGCDTLPKVFDATKAGVGPCGGTCRPSIVKMLEQFSRSGDFPQDPRPRQKPRRR